MGEYATISVPVKVKEILKRIKGEDEWGRFLLHLCEEVERLRRKEAFKELASTLSDEELKRVLDSEREFRQRFKLRSRTHD